MRRLLLAVLLCLSLALRLCWTEAVILDKEVQRHLDAALRHYEVLHPSHLSHTAIRSNMPRARDNLRRVDFSAFGRKFQLYLSPHQKIFGPKFKVYSVNEKSEKRQVAMDLDEHYTGRVFGEESSLVTAHISKQGVITAFIRTPHDTYYVQPASHLIGTSATTTPHMIAFRSSDVKNRLTRESIDYVVAPPINEIPVRPSNEAPPLGDDDGPDQLSGHQIEDGHLSKDSSKDEKQPSKHPSGQTQQTVQTQTQVKEDGGIASFREDSPQRVTHHEHLRKRRAQAGDACGLLLVADYRLFRELGSSIEGLSNQLISLILTIDNIYKSTSWVTDVSGSTIDNIGFFIQDIMIHQAPSNDPYNRAGDLEAGPLLDAFNDGHGNGTVWDGYCLAHLFTYTDFGGLLGLANIASPNPGETGGICSTGFSTSSGSRIIYNTGYSTFVNRGNTLIMEEVLQVTGHELGHNWGSNHDPATDPECSDSYLMNEYAQDGSQPTHRQFSICSRRRVGQVILSKSFCFNAPSEVNCGNYILDEGEECDEGPHGNTRLCCDDNCMLSPGSVCSDINNVCCENCAATSTKVCRFFSAENSMSCKRDTVCRDDSFSCPDAEPAPVNSSCRNGLCKDDDGGVVMCKQFCAIVGLSSCQCSGSLECLVCCSSSAQDGECVPYQSANGTVNLAFGAECSVGICSDGACVEQLQDESTRLWDVIVNLNINNLGVFIKQNIVGSVLFFTIVAWIPVAFIIHCFLDRKLVKRFWSHEKEDMVDSVNRRVTNFQHLFHEALTLPRNFRYHPQGTSDDKDPMEGPPITPRETGESPVDDLPLPARYSQSGRMSGLTSSI